MKKKKVHKYKGMSKYQGIYMYMYTQTGPQQSNMYEFVYLNGISLSSNTIIWALSNNL